MDKVDVLTCIRTWLYCQHATLTNLKTCSQRVILRAWLRVRDSKRFKHLKEAWELEQSQAVLEDIRREGEETVDDIEDVYKDIETQKVG